MSVVAHTGIGQNNIASVPVNSEPSVTAISVSARIDYIQRFSKQAVLVIDNDVNAYTQAARQFLGNFSTEQSTQETNVAFVSASTKLNDIQMRCRLIEQLFANTLFDPEKSLAVSILNLSKQSKDSINIIVEHAHALSLQIKYELCQLVDVANKTHSKINVVLFGLEQAAQDAAVNKSIFKSKLSVIDAKSGQLFSLDHGKFTNNDSILNNKFWLKLVATIVVVSALIGLTWYGLIHYDDFSLSKLSAVDTKTPENRAININAQQENQKEKEQSPVSSLAIDEALAIKPPVVLAETSDIEAALLGKSLMIKSNNQEAQVKDVLQALDRYQERDTVHSTNIISSDQQALAQDVSLTNVSESAIAQTIAPEKDTAALSFKLTPEYYYTASTGYVVQLVGFSNKDLLSRFIETYPNLEYFSYQKKLNDQSLIILTTAIFETKLLANSAIEKLPQGIIDRGVWVKPLALVQTEMNSL